MIKALSMLKQLLPLFACSVTLSISAQENYYTQYNSSKTNTNPAFVGSDSVFVLSSATIFQLPIKESDDYLFFSADNYFRFLRGGLGLNFNRQSLAAGNLVTSTVELAYAPHFEFFNHKLAFQPALAIGYFQRTIDWTKLTFGDMIDAKSNFVYDSQEPGALDKKMNLDLSTGFLLFTRIVYGGFAMHHLNQPDRGLAGTQRLPIRHTLHGGANLLAGCCFELSPNFIYQWQADFSFLLAGITAKYKWMVAGIALGNYNKFVSTIGLQNRFFRLNYSYCLQDVYGSISEIHFNWFFKHKNKKQLSLRII